MRRVWLTLTFPALLAPMGCYIYAPVQGTTPPVGQTTLMSISDQGRVELGDRLGRGVSRIEARVTGTEGDQLLLNVFSVKYVSGESSRWSGESMRLNRSFVEQLSTRTLSKQRTWIAAGSAAVVVTAFIATHGLLGRFTGDREPGTEPPPASLRLNFGFPH